MNPNEEELNPQEQKPLIKTEKIDESGVGEYGIGAMMNVLNHGGEPVDEEQGVYHFSEEQLDHKSDSIDTVDS